MFRGKHACDVAAVRRITAVVAQMDAYRSALAGAAWKVHLAPTQYDENRMNLTQIE